MPFGPASSSVTSVTSPSRTAEDAAERQLLVGVVAHARQPERRVGEAQRAVGAVDEVVRAVEPAALEAVGEHGRVAVRVDADDAAVAVLADRQPARRGRTSSPFEPGWW